MHRTTAVLPFASLALAGLALAAPQSAPAAKAAPAQNPAAAQQELPLTGAIPQDVFLYTWGKHNPERAFLEQHWNKVWEALKASKIPQDLLDLALTAADEEQQALISELHARFGERIAAVDWKGLVGGESAFAERLPRLRFLPGSKPLFAMEMAVLFRPAPEADVEAIHKSLGALLDTFVEEVGKRTPLKLAVERSAESGLELATLDLFAGQVEGQKLPLVLGRTGRTIFLSFGESITGDVAGLLQRTGSVQPLIANARMRKAFAELPQAEDGAFYFDMVNLRTSLQGVVDQAFELATPKGAEGEPAAPTPAEVEIGRKVVGRLLDSMGVLSCSATVQTTEGHSTHSYTAALLAQDAASNPIYPVLSSSAPIEDFARYLPRETKSFMVDAGFSLPALYTYIQDTFAVAGEPGSQAWKMWEAKQAEVGFDVRKDLLAWLDTASVQAEFAVDGQDASIFMMRVLEDEAARKGLEWALETVADLFAERASEVPQLAMFAPNITPSTNPALEGFHNVGLGVLIPPMTVGVRDGWMFAGSSDKAVLRVMDTAAGKHENVRANAELMAKALVPEGKAQSVAFADHRGKAQAIAQAIQMVGQMGPMVAMNIPDPEGREIVTEMLAMVSRLGPVISTIDFFDSTATVATFDGKGWRMHSVTHYVEPVKTTDAK
jgi:hypothetical protein